MLLLTPIKHFYLLWIVVFFNFLTILMSRTNKHPVFVCFSPIRQKDYFSHSNCYCCPKYIINVNMNMSVPWVCQQWHHKCFKIFHKCRMAGNVFYFCWHLALIPARKNSLPFSSLIINLEHFPDTGRKVDINQVLWLLLCYLMWSLLLSLFHLYSKTSF